MTGGSVVHRIDPQYFANILLRIVPDLPQPVVESLWSAHEARCYSPAEFLLQEGKASQGVFLIVSGAVSLSLSKSVKQGRTIHSRELRAPTILGVSDTLLNSPVSLSARALSEVCAAFIHKAAFLKAVRQSPSAGIAFSHLIAQELSCTYSRLTELRGTTPG